MGHFSDFLAIFQYNFGDSWDIHGRRPIILGYFFPIIMMEIGKFQFKTAIVQREVIFHIFGQFFLHHNFYAKIGPLQLSVVLASINFD